MDSDFINSISKILPQPRHSSDYSSSITVRTLPLIGRIHVVNDIRGMLMCGFIFAYWIYGSFCTYFIILLPQYNDGHIPCFVVVCYLFISVMCLLSLVKASLTNPGRIPLAREERDFDTSEWTFCKTCMRKRPPRAHHCRRCQQCVMRMDHHCPWINNCVGEENHFCFILLLVYGFLLSFCTFLLTIFHFWVWPKCHSCDQEAFHIKHSIWFLYILVLMACCMMGGLFCQLGLQHVNLLLGMTTLEGMQKLPNAESKDHKLRPLSSAYRELCGWGTVLCWLWPCRQRSPLLHTVPNFPV